MRKSTGAQRNVPQAGLHYVHAAGKRGDRVTPRDHWRVRTGIALLLLAGTLRAFALWSHAPLYAYANSYDQTRYTACFAFYPDRAVGIAPTQNSPQAPFAKFRFDQTADPMCYWSSELVFTGATALIWKIGEAFGGGGVHDVRWVGALRWLVLLALSIALSRAWLDRGDTRAALANAVLVPLLFADPGNTFYLDTFYAEGSALLAAYALVGASVLWRDAPRSRLRFAWLALAAFALATSKIQHLLLPLALGLVLLLLDRLRGRARWRAGALLLGASAGFLVQFAQLHRDAPMMDAIDQYNRADVVFTALLPFADDPRALLAQLHVDPDCAIYSGHHAWEFPDLPERVCAGLAHFTRATELATLARHPMLALRLAAHGVLGLDPWIAKNLGEVEGGDFSAAPVASIGHALHAWPIVQLVALALPLLGLSGLLIRPGWRRGSVALDLTALSVSMMIATLGITVLGDGLADTAKQGHLVVNAALAWLVIALIGALWKFAPDVVARANEPGNLAT